MMVKKSPPYSSGPSLPIIGGLVLFSVVLGTTDLGYIPVPTAAKHATTMHLPTILASVVEGWPFGMLVGTIFGLTSMYMAGAAMVQDPFVAVIPRILVGITPWMVYTLMQGRSEYARLIAAAVAGTLTNTVLLLSLAVLFGYMPLDNAVNVALVHGLPECVVAMVAVVPGVMLLRRFKGWLERFSGYREIE